MLLRRLARDSAIYGGSEFFSKLIAFLAFPLIAAVLSPLEFGALELMLTATALLGIIANCGLNNSLQRFYWDTQTGLSQRPVLVSSGLAALSLSLIAALALGGSVLLVYGHWVEEEHFPLGWLGLLFGLVLMAAGQLVQFLMDVTRLHMAPWRFAGIALVSRVMTATAGLVTVVWLGWGLNGFIAAQALVMLAAVPLALYAVRKDLTFRLDQAVARKLMRFGHPFIYAGLAFWLFGSMDRWLLAYMSTVEEVGVYSIAYRFASVILFVSMAFGQAWSPLAIKIQADHPQIYRAIYVDILLALLCSMLAIGAGVALFSQEIIIWLMPAEYYGAALLLSVLTLGLILQSTLQVTAIGISLEKKTYFFGRLSWMAVALNLILNLLMIPAAGGLGAAVATAMSYLFLTGAYLFYTQRLHPLPLPWGKLFVLAVLWMTVAGCLIGQWSGHHAASSVAWRLSVMFVVLLVCAKLIPIRRGAHVER